MHVRRLLPFMILAALLAGCETSAVWYASHPDKKMVMIDGAEISVVPRRPNEFDAWGGDEGTRTNTAVLKARQVRAVERVSKCQVRSAEYMPGTWVLQTVVTCGS